MSPDAPPDPPRPDDAPTRSVGVESAPTRRLDAAPAATPTRKLPERVGRWRVGAVLGRGGMGVVARGHDDETGEEVALKFLDRALSGDDAELDRVDREARLLAALRHPHVALMLGVEEDAGLPVLVLELVDGESLSEILRVGPIAIDRALDVAFQVASAVEAAHAMGIVHRDLKPSNVKLATDGRAKVLDFGLACRVATSAPRSLASEAADLDPGGVSGSIGYMPPEQLRGAPPDRTADTWALGVLLFELLSGRPAFPGRTQEARLDATLHATPDLGALRVGAPAPVRAIVARCLERDPASRPSHAGEIAAVLRPHAPSAHAAPPAAPVAAPASRLPRPVTRFVGRRAELAAIRGLLAHARLVTITGAGGSGKTRLALEAGLRLESGQAGVPRPATFVELAELSAGGDVDQAVATALGVADRQDADLREALVHSLGDEDRVLVLDNCEHVLAGARSLGEALLRECPRLAILATSRAPLHAEGESVFALPTLRVPDAETSPEALAACESVALFVERARAASRSFRLDEGTAPLVARCCRRLDGIPLALELAAARLRAMPLPALADALDASLEVVSGGSARALPRHQALSATIDWSHDALDADERRAHRRLAVFQGPFTLPLAESVLGVDRARAADLVTRLVEASLVEQRVGTERTTWRVLEPIRQHAAPLLAASGEAAAARAGLLAGMSRFGAAAWPRLEGDDMPRCVAEVSELHANLVEALRVAAEDDRADEGVELLAWIAAYFIARAHWREGRALAEALLGAPSLSVRGRGRCRVMSGQFSMLLGDSAIARERIESALPDLRAAGDDASLSDGLNSLSQVHWQVQELPLALELAEESLAIRRRIGKLEEIANSLNQIGLLARSFGDLATARARLDECLEILRPLGNAHALGILLANIGVVALDQPDTPAARRYLEEALVQARACGSRRGELFAEANLGATAFEEGRLDDCAAHSRTAAAIAAEIGDRSAALTVAWTLARLAAARGELERAAMLHGANVAIREAIGAKRFTRQEAWEEHVRMLRAKMGDARFDAAFDAGRALTFDETLKLGE